MLAVLSLKGATRQPLLETGDAGQTVQLQLLTCYTKLLCEIFLPFVNLSFETGFQLCRSGWPRTQGTGLEVRLYNRIDVGSRA